ncbi:TadE/TadG family type IV pilus assembly protein [Paenibacillus sp. GCM10027627]|uniref:TadE/TadG family type IV pilus assembly protein n=1 Tax=unclassified Paenibacillus TaxID=185978 RepID=UPI0036403A2F
MSSSREWSWNRDERGSFTIEAVMVFPLLFAMILAFVLLGMYLYQKAVVYYAAVITAERASFSWDNSKRESATGILMKAEYDSLYRRMGTDGVLASIFGLGKEDEHTSVVMPGGLDGNGEGPIGLIKSKLIGAAQWMTNAGLPYSGTMKYSGGLAVRNVEVRLKKPIALVPWEGNGSRKEPKAEVKSGIVDPVEFIRGVDLARYFADKLANHPMGKTTAKERAGGVLSTYGEQK